jgi:hypothetical protein
VEVLVVDISDVLLDDVPVRPVLPQRRAELRLVFHCACMVEASHLETECLTPTACAKFQDGEAHVWEVDFIFRVCARLRERELFSVKRRRDSQGGVPTGG